MFESLKCFDLGLKPWTVSWWALNFNFPRFPPPPPPHPKKMSDFRFNRLPMTRNHKNFLFPSRLDCLHRKNVNFVFHQHTRCADEGKFLSSTSKGFSQSTIVASLHPPTAKQFNKINWTAKANFPMCRDSGYLIFFPLHAPSSRSCSDYVMEGSLHVLLNAVALLFVSAKKQKARNLWLEKFAMRCNRKKISSRFGISTPWQSYI